VGGAADYLAGVGGNDTYVVEHAGDVVDESVAGSGGTDTVQSALNIDLTDTTHFKGQLENITLTGTGAVNAIGNSLGNVITGNGASNSLTGNGGADYFVFSSTPSPGNIDTITDFTAVDDTIALNHLVFAALATGTLAGADFTTSAPINASQHIIYNATTGALSYDDDGNGAHAAVQFATLTGHPAITNADFLVV
jgi:Ca2+-binding RTX toxin-like protein